MSEEGRARIAAAQKKRWEAKRAAKLSQEAATATDAEVLQSRLEATIERAKHGGATALDAKMLLSAYEAITGEPVAPAAEPEASDLGGIPPQPEPIHRLHRCLNCGWEIQNKTFLDAITAHSEFHKQAGNECKPCLTQPSEKFEKRQLLERLRNNPRSVKI